MNIEARKLERDAKGTSATKLQFIDCDIHPKASIEDYRPYLSKRWWDYAQTYGARSHHGYVKGFPYPKSQPLAARRDAWPPDGGLPASNYEFMRAQHLDLYGIEYAIMNPLSPSGQGEQNDGFSAALAFAANEFQLNHWNALDARLKASLVVPYEDPDASRQEIRRRAGDRRFAQVLMLTRTAELMGRARYWPIYEAACEAGLPVGVHVFGYSGRAVSNTGWPSFYVEEMTEHASACQAQVTSLIMEGVFERFPQLKFVFIEGGFGWLPALGYRLDRAWQRMGADMPQLKRPPSDYLRRHFWVTTQPMEEPERPAHLRDIMQAIGFDRILFSSDYPHWDFDDPFVAIPRDLAEARRRQIYSGNARALYGFA